MNTWVRISNVFWQVRGLVAVYSTCTKSLSFTRVADMLASAVSEYSGTFEFTSRYTGLPGPSR